MKHGLILSILIIIFSVHICFGQNDWKPGYIIKLQGDTIYGFIDNRGSKSNSQQCYFRKEEVGETQILKPQDLVGYRFIDSKLFISKNIDGLEYEMPVFLEFLFSGKVNIYHLKDENDRYFIEKNADMYELKNTLKLDTIDKIEYLKEKKEYIGTLKFLFQDAMIQTEINESKFTPQSLIKISKNYHKKVCPEEKCIVYEKSLAPIHINWGLHTGLSVNTMDFGTYTTTNYGLGNLLGCRLEFENVIDWQENLNFVLDFTFQRFTNYELSQIKDRSYSRILYNNTAYILTNNNIYSTEVKYLDVNINTIALKIPLTMNYIFSKSNIRPYIGAGFINMFILSQNKDFIYRLFYDEFNNSIPTYHLGLVGKVGCKYMLQNKQSIYAELNFEHTESMNINELLQLKNNLSSFIVGYAF